MSFRRGKPTGWAAYDLEQRDKNIFAAQASNDPFPLLSNTVTFETLSINSQLSEKPFSSVIRPSVQYHARVSNKKTNKLSEVGTSTGPRSYNVSQGNNDQVLSQLKELYTWADDNLIEDVMAAAGNKFNKASSYLKAMISEENLEKNKDNKVRYSGHDSMELVKNNINETQGVSFGKVSEFSDACSVLDPCFGDNNGNVGNELNLDAEKLSDGSVDMNELQAKLACVLHEPEWEEDDVYLNCRKDAIKMMRDAARHSKAASTAYLRGNHFSAQQYSLKAREEWVAAEMLNAKAAREILSTRNENNGIWRLDLHGLHRAEAIEALQERLHMIETQIFFKGSKSQVLCSLMNKAQASQASSYDQLSNGRTVFGQKPMWLEVITGVGNHSRGGAALPVAVRNFLAHKGYHINEARPGVIMVRPKIRHT